MNAYERLVIHAALQDYPGRCHLLYRYRAQQADCDGLLKRRSGFTKSFINISQAPPAKNARGVAKLFATPLFLSLKKHFQSVKTFL
jgi:hypothetical protein